jgi:S1-C subfamily serine protease
MRIITFIAAAVLVSPLSAQTTVPAAHAGAPRFMRAVADGPHAVIGVTTNAAATDRDTLGVLVSSVRPGSPAEKAGIEEGDRIAAINGVSLKLAAVDVGAYEMAGSMTRRLTRELDKLKPGDDVELRVYSGGQTKTIRVKTMPPADLERSVEARSDADRATLGIQLAITGNARDTIGVFVMSVEDGSPAAKAGIEEGSRIASIDGVDVRERRTADADDYMARMNNTNRLQRELARVKPGDDVELRVYFNGQYRAVKLKAARASDLPRRRSMTIISNDNSLMPAMAPMLDRLAIDAPMLRGELRSALDGMRGAAVMMPRIGNRVSW